MTISKSRLGQLTYLDEGGFATVYRVDDLRLPGDPSPLAYKEFTTNHAAQAKSARVAVDFRNALSPADRAGLDAFSAWPRELVEDPAVGICGLLMPLIPPDFFCRQTDSDTGKLVNKPRSLSWLITTSGQRQAAQVDLPDIAMTDRLVLLAQLVYVIGRLHKNGMVYGDISFKNAAFALDPPRLLLLDCDGAAPVADQSREQSSTPNWDPPECPINPPRQQELQDCVTDVYKLGLALLRVLAPGKGASTTRSVGRMAGELDAAGTDLVRRALSEDRSIRPTAKDLYFHLSQLARPRVTAPEMSHAELLTPVCLRGQDARIAWRFNGATSVTVRVGNALTVDVDAAQHPDGYVFRTTESGPVCVQASNRFGSTTVDLGELTLYELPPFQINVGGLPVPQVPALDDFSPPILDTTVANRPVAGVGAIDVPQIPSIGTLPLIEALEPVGRAATPWPRVGESLIQASSAVSGILQRVNSEFTASLEPGYRAPEWPSPPDLSQMIQQKNVSP